MKSYYMYILKVTFSENEEKIIRIYGAFLTLESLRLGGVKLTPLDFLVLNFCSLTDCQKLWHNCSLFVNTSFDANLVTS